jgi:hypothetical protein
MLKGCIKKMKIEADSPASYRLPLGEEELAINPLLQCRLSIRYSGRICCLHCGRETKKSFSQGYCYPCFKKLAQCDLCIVKPELCHYQQGTCREPEWAQQHCLQPHFVYLSNTSGIKVGITRHTQIPTRWLDQGAAQAILLFQVHNRLQSGETEVILKSRFNDKTDWRKMLKQDPEQRNMTELRDEILAIAADSHSALGKIVEANKLLALPDAAAHQFGYPVKHYLDKISSFNLDKNPLVEGTLIGAKGQYLIFDTGVINMRKYGGYELEITF